MGLSAEPTRWKWVSSWALAMSMPTMLWAVNGVMYNRSFPKRYATLTSKEVEAHTRCDQPCACRLLPIGGLRYCSICGVRQEREVSSTQRATRPRDRDRFLSFFPLLVTEYL